MTKFFCILFSISSVNPVFSTENLETDFESKITVINGDSELCLDLNIFPQNPSCAIGDDGSITIDFIGGTPKYSVFWDGPGIGLPNNGSVSSITTNTFTISNLSAGNFEIFAIDAKDCEGSASIKLTDPPAFSFTAVESDPTCAGDNNGTIKVFDFVNGDPLYSVQWNGPGKNDGVVNNVNGNLVITGLPTGSYNIQVTDSKGCSSVVNGVFVTEIASPNVNIIGDTQLCADQSSGTLSTSPIGFSSYSWSTGSSSSSISIFGAGTYEVTVTNSNGCSASDIVSVSQIPDINIVLENASSNLSESCAGTCDGSLNITVTGGSGTGNEFSWEGPGGFTSSIQDISSLCAGTYKVTVTDSEGCTETFVQNITSPPAFDASFDTNGISCSGNNDGSIDIAWAGGIGPYSVSWSGPNNGTQSGINAMNYSIQNLNSGTYNIELVDDRGCIINQSVTISNAGTFSFSASEASPSCNGSASGSILVSSYTNGSGPYDISWSGPSSGIQSNDPGDYTITGLAAGSYDIMVVDNNGCSNTINGIVVSESSDISVSIVGDLIFCSDQPKGTLSTSPTTFTSYSWNTGATSNSINIANPGLSGMTYSVTVNDVGGCTGTAAVNALGLPDINITLNTSSSQSATGCGSSCDANLNIDVSGGSGSGYNYLWQGPDGYSSTLQDISNLCAGNYNVTVTDNNGCTSSFTQSVSSEMDVIASATATATSCFGAGDGSIMLTFSGGASPYSFLWSNGATSQNLINLDGGTYSVTVRDANGCTANTMATVGESGEISAIISPSAATICAGESVTLAASGRDSYE